MRLVNGYSYRLVILNQTQHNYMILHFQSQLMRYEHLEGCGKTNDNGIKTIRMDGLINLLLRYSRA
jgi:hypothetical protein